MVLEATLDKPFEQHMRAILDRIDLKRSSFSPRFDLRGKLATGYIATLDGQLKKAPLFELGNAPAANLYTTTNDLGAFLKVVFADGLSPNGEILNAETFEEMWTVQLSTARRQVPYGLGFTVSVLEEERMASLSSSFQGYSTYLAILPDQDLGVALLANLEYAAPSLERIGQYALRLLHAIKSGVPPPAQPLLARPDSTMRAMAAGDYTADGTFYIAQSGNELYLYHNFGRSRLRQEGDSLVLDDRHQPGAIMLADGVSVELGNTLYSKSEPAPPASTPPYLAGLMGMYGPPEHPLLVMERDGILYALKDWVHAFPLREIAADTFALPDDGLYGGERLVFSRDENGVAATVDFAHMALERKSAGAYTIEPVDLPLVHRPNRLACGFAPHGQDRAKNVSIRPSDSPSRAAWEGCARRRGLHRA
jgi:hypothetical protein